MAIYVYDRRDGVWYRVDFEDQKYFGYNLDDLEVLLERCRFLRLVENPRLLREREWLCDHKQLPQAPDAPSPVGGRSSRATCNRLASHKLGDCPLYAAEI